MATQDRVAKAFFGTNLELFERLEPLERFERIDFKR
jgi:hypothetical protein